MLNVYSGAYSNQQRDAVATLIYHCGVGMNMEYGPTGSSVVYWHNGTNVTTCNKSNAIENFFGYNISRTRFSHTYTPQQFQGLLKSELDASRPILYSGQGVAGGHGFICDGYDDEDFFHFNLG